MITSIPRIDLVVWILISRVIPDAVHRLRAIQAGATLRELVVRMKVKQRRPDLVKAIQEGGRGPMPMPMPMPSWASRGEFRKHKASWRASFKSE
jgi:hypothetical protein